MRAHVLKRKTWKTMSFEERLELLKLSNKKAIDYCCEVMKSYDDKIAYFANRINNESDLAVDTPDKKYLWITSIKALAIRIGINRKRNFQKFLALMSVMGTIQGKLMEEKQLEKEVKKNVPDEIYTDTELKKQIVECNLDPDTY